MKYKMFLSVILLLSMMLYQSIAAYPSQAEEIRYPVPCYEGEELEKVRAWEKQWEAKKIDAGNIDGVKEFLPDALYDIHKNTEKWGTTWFTIVPYRFAKPTKGDIKYTLEGKCTIAEDGILQNYVSGIPFPHPKNGLEIGYNFDNLNWGDQMMGRQDVILVDGRRKYDRKMDITSHIMYFAGRRDIPEVPEVSYNPKGIYRGIHSYYDEPAAYKGTRTLLLKWKDRTRDWANWSFSSSTRRIRRRSMAERQSSTGGSDTCGDDNSGYAWAINVQDYKILGRKEILIARHQDQEELVKGRTEGKCLDNGRQRERINTYVVEAIHKDPDYIYNKQIWYMDPETWAIIYADKYDRDGKLWKVFDIAMYMIPSEYDGQEVQTMCMLTVIDVQRIHSTNTRSEVKLGPTGEFYKPAFYEPRALMKYGY